jgi:putative transposase
MALPQAPNQRCSLDFVSNALACSRKFPVLTVVDGFSRECLALVVDNSLSGIRVARELDGIVERRGTPCMVVSDNGTELTSHAMTRLAAGPRRRMALHHSWQADAERLHRVVQWQAA